MSSTNKTPNYDLSQFIGSDKPAWLQDYNGDMNKIDTGIKNASDIANGANGKADANTTNIGDLSYLSTSAKNNLVSAVNEVDSKAETAQGTANSASASANSALTKAEGLENSLNINVFQNLTLTTSTGSLSGGSNIRVARNSDGSLAKIYGHVRILNPSTSGDTTITTSDTGLRPESPIVFQGCTQFERALKVRITGTTQDITIPYSAELDYTLNTDGTITATLPFGASSLQEFTITFIACLLFIKDFGE